MDSAFSIIFYSTLAGVATIIGIIMVIYKEEWVLKHSRHVNSFAAGLILGVAFFHLFPESLELSENALTYILIGFLRNVFQKYIVLSNYPRKNLESLFSIYLQQQ